MKKAKKGCIAAVMVVCMIVLSSGMAYADGAYTYNYDYWGDVQYSPDAYATAGVYTFQDLGLDKRFNAPSGMYIAGDMVYICDTGNNRILEIRRTGVKDFETVRVIESVRKDSEISLLSGPTDVCVDVQGCLYICDKGNGRILKLDRGLNYVMEFTKPTDATFDQSLAFLPDKLAVDTVGRVYCIADNVNKGLIKYDTDGTFTGFSGASEVTYNWADYIWKNFATQAQRSTLESFVPTEYDNLYMDGEGFIYACTTNVSDKGITAGDDTPIRRINMMGKDILIRNGNIMPVGDIVWGKAGSDGGYTGPSQMTDITALDGGIYFGLDKVRGRLFGYDNQGNLLYAFGGVGNMDGYFRQPVAIDHMGQDLFVLDTKDASFTVFTPTEYGSLIFKAMDEYDKGDYAKSGETWKLVMRQNGNYDLAYIGIGRALMREGQYHEAMKYFKLKWNTDNYSKAFQQYRKDWVEDHIVLIFGGLVLVFVIPMIIGKVRRVKREIDTSDLFKL